MALYLWTSQSASITIGNKQANNTGISYVGLSDSGTYITADRLDNLTNTEAGNTNASTGSFTAIGRIGDHQFKSFSLTAYVSWKSGGVTDTHKVDDVVICNPAVSLEILGYKMFYSDNSQMYVSPMLKAYNGSSSATSASAFYSNSAATLHCKIAELNNVSFSAKDNNVVNIYDKFTAVASTLFTTSGEKEITLSMSSLAGDVDSTGRQTAGPNVISGSTKINVRNATSKVELNNATTDTSIYIAAGQSREISYTVIPQYAGIAYSYALQMSTVCSSDVTTFTTTAPTSTAKGKLTFTTKNNASGKSTTLQFKSIAANGGSVLSPIVTIYVTAANTEIFINVGDIYQMSVLDGDSIKTAPDSKIASAEVTGSGANRKLVITAANVTGNTAKTTVTMTSGTVITVNVAHLSITIA